MDWYWEKIIWKLGILFIKEMKIIQYEINELPFAVLDRYCSKFKDSKLANFCINSEQYSTEIKENKELHPWSTWPSVHRGIEPEEHGIKMLNQDIGYAEKYQTIWDDLIARDKSIGVWGSLHSYFLPKNRHVKFYFPDPFSSRYKAFPNSLRDFQKLSESISDFFTKTKTFRLINKALLNPLIFLVKGNLSLQDLRSIIKILINYRAPLNQTTFTFIQAELSFNRFLIQLRETKPDVAFFFSNHLAGAMHRYWQDFFSSDTKIFNKSSVLIAMKIFDSHINKLVKLSNSFNQDVAIALVSSMGQAPVTNNQNIDIRASIKKSDLFFENILGFKKSSLNTLSAMRPDIVIAGEKKDLDFFYNRLKHLKDKKSPIFDITYKHEKNSLTMNLSSRESLKLFENKYLSYNGKLYKPKDLGLSLYNQEHAQAYHIPEGVFILNNLANGYTNKKNTRRNIKAINVKDKLINLVSK